MTNKSKIKAIADEMAHDIKDTALGEKELRARLRYYRKRIIEIDL
jgi:hypothetical protein